MWEPRWEQHNDRMVKSLARSIDDPESLGMALADAYQLQQAINEAIHKLHTEAGFSFPSMAVGASRAHPISRQALEKRHKKWLREQAVDDM